MDAHKFADSHNTVAFLEKPTECEGFEQIVDFLNANPIKYALTVNPTIYTSCIEQFWATAKEKTVNGEEQLQALVDKKKVIITESIIRRDLHLEDDEGIYCLPNAVIFEELTRMGFLNQQVGDMSTHDDIYVTPSHTKKVFGNMKMVGKGFSGNITPLFPTMMVQAQEEIEPIAEEAANKENVPTHSNDPLLSGEDSLKLNELMELCTNLQKMVLDLETSKTAQAQEITSLKQRVKKLERRNKSRTHKLKRLYKVGRSRRVESSEESLGDQEDASKHGRIDDIDADEDITLDNTHFDNDPDMFGVHDLDGDEVFVENKELVVNAATTAKLKSAKPKATTTAASIRPKTKWLVIDDQEQAPTPTLIVFSSQSSQAKVQDKGKGIMVEEPLKMKKKDQISFDQQEAIRLQAEFDEEERIAREKFESNATLTEE
ncbi:hypothetical protein Tco_0321109 [Tanacetum coccineum]